MELKDTKTSINHEQLVFDHTLAISAVAKPVESITRPSVLRASHIPINFLDIGQQIEPEVYAKGETRRAAQSVSVNLALTILEYSLCFDMWAVFVLSAILLQIILQH